MPTDGLHSDAAAKAERKLTLIYYPRFEPEWQPGHGGELAFRRPDGTDALVEPRCDRLVLFNAEQPHQVLPCLTARVSLTLWGLGTPGLRLAPPLARINLIRAYTLPYRVTVAIFAITFAPFIHTSIIHTSIAISTHRLCLQRSRVIRLHQSQLTLEHLDDGKVRERLDEEEPEEDLCERAVRDEHVVCV